MYRSFTSLDELFTYIKEDKEWTGANAAQHNRYPIRSLRILNCREKYVRSLRKFRLTTLSYIHFRKWLVFMTMRLTPNLLQW